MFHCPLDCQQLQQTVINKNAPKKRKKVSRMKIKEMKKSLEAIYPTHDLYRKHKCKQQSATKYFKN